MHVTLVALLESVEFHKFRALKSSGLFVTADEATKLLVVSPDMPEMRRSFVSKMSLSNIGRKSQRETANSGMNFHKSHLD